jgi:hypothetical protein
MSEPDLHLIATLTRAGSSEGDARFLIGSVLAAYKHRSVEAERDKYRDEAHLLTKERDDALREVSRLREAALALLDHMEFDSRDGYRTDKCGPFLRALGAALAAPVSQEDPQ